MQRLKIAPVATSLVVAIAAVLVWTALSPIAAQQPTTPAKVAETKWEYKITDVVSESYLNQLGNEGWELCETTLTISTTSKGFKEATYSNVTSKTRLILKRPRH